MTSVSAGEAEGEEKRREEEYEYTHIRIPTRLSKYPKLQLYIPIAKQLLVQNVKEILKREGSSISKFMIDKFEEYYRLHEPGNPQQRLDVIVKLGKAYHAPSPICGFKDCLRDVVAVGIYLRTQTEYGLCQKHLTEAQQLGPKVWRFLT